MSSDGISNVLSFLSFRSEEPLGAARENSSDVIQEHGLPDLEPTAEPTDEALFAEVGNGSKEALGVLFRRYRRPVVNMARRILNDDLEAEDLCQEVFLVLFEKASLFDPAKGTASSWILQIAYRRALNRRQYLAHRQHYTPQDVEPDEIGSSQLPNLAARIDARALLERLREQLTADQWTTLELFFFEGYSLREIAERIDQPLGNVRHHYYRALERLRANVFPQKNR